MIIKNYEIQAFGEFLYEMKLKSKNSRMRTRFVDLLQSHLDMINRERDELVKDYAKRDEDNEIVTEEHDGKMAYILDNPQEYNHAVTVLMNEDFILEETEGRMEMLRTVRDAVLNFDEELSGDDAMMYDRFCEIVEDIAE